MAILLGLILVITALVLTLTGTAMQFGGPQGFLFGVEVGVVGMIGMRWVRGEVGERVAAHRPRPAGDGYRRR